MEAHYSYNSSTNDYILLSHVLTFSALEARIQMMFSLRIEVMTSALTSRCTWLPTRQRVGRYFALQFLCSTYLFGPADGSCTTYYYYARLEPPCMVESSAIHVSQSLQCVGYEKLGAPGWHRVSRCSDLELVVGHFHVDYESARVILVSALYIFSI